jgi:hypothetical protein
MKDYLAQVEKLRKDAAECALIRDLTTREMFDRLASHLTVLADQVEQAIIRRKPPTQKAVSVGVRNPSLAGAGRAFDGIDFAARLYRLDHDGEARSVASGALMFFDLRHHTEPFRPPRSASCPAYIRTLPCVVIRSLPSR